MFPVVTSATVRKEVFLPPEAPFRLGKVGT